MASPHLCAQFITRGSGHSAVAKAAYNARERLDDERTGATHDFTRHSSKCLFEGIYAPKDAPAWTQDRAQLWNHVEAFEKHRRAELAQEINIALPHELTLEQNRRLLQDWVRENVTRKGLIADVAIHAPDRRGDVRNIHAHVMVVRRKLDGSEFVRTKERFDTFSEKQAAKEADLVAMRTSWGNLANRHLERYGHEARIDMGRKADGEATLHMGRHATAQERRGVASELGNRNRAIHAENSRIAKAAEQEAFRQQIQQAQQREALRQQRDEFRERVATDKAHNQQVRDQIREEVREHVRQNAPLRPNGPEADRRAERSAANEDAARAPKNPHWREEIRPRPNAPERGRGDGEPIRQPERPASKPEASHAPAKPPRGPISPGRSHARPSPEIRQAAGLAGKSVGNAGKAAGKVAGGLMGVIGAVLGAASAGTEKKAPERETEKPRAPKPPPPPEKEKEQDNSRSRFEAQPIIRLLAAFGMETTWIPEAKKRLIAYSNRTGISVIEQLTELDNLLHRAVYGPA